MKRVVVAVHECIVYNFVVLWIMFFVTLCDCIVYITYVSPQFEQVYVYMRQAEFLKLALRACV